MSAPEDFYKDILDNLYDGVYFVDPERRITYWNRGAERISGFLGEQVLGHHCADNILMHVDDKGTVLCRTACPLADTLRDGKAREVDVRLQHANGQRVSVRVHATPMRAPDGSIIGAVEVFSDNSAIAGGRQQAQELKDAGQTDPLTGVGNRRYVEAQTVAALNDFRNQGVGFGLLFVGIDDFRTVNTVYGHAVGDKVLAMAGGTLRQSVRASDAVGRWGGDEFAVVLRRVNLDQVFAVASKLRLIVEKSRLTSAQHTIRITVSIGATLARSGDSPDSLYSRANGLLRQAKAAGRNYTSYSA
jgi:diguanylate cyclase (GGDEF)-like protein/PAS domain S-box-containing protein